MGQKLGWVQGSRRPRPCEVKRTRLHDGGGKTHNKRQSWWETTRINQDNWQLRNTIGK